MTHQPHAPDSNTKFVSFGNRMFPDLANDQRNVQRLVGIIGGGGTILVGLVNWLQHWSTNNLLLSESFLSSYTGLILLMGFINVGCGFWKHSIARWTHIGLFVFSGVFGAISANRGNITSAFFIVFAIILLAEYRVRRGVALVVAPLMLAGYVAALAIGYQDDVSLPVVSAFASLITVVTFVGLFGGVVLLHRAQLRQDAALLEERIQARTKDLNQAIRERNVMLQEIHHRVKNNMQTISTLLAMEADKMPDAAATAALDASQQRIRAMASVHDVLYRSERLDRVNLAEYTRDLLDTLLQTALYPVELDVQVADAGTVDLSFAVSLGLALNELVSNALKHGLSPSGGGRLRVALHSDDGMIVLEVEDNGAGLPDGFTPESTQGVGMKVVTSIVRHSGGHLRHESGAGTRWHLELPVSARES